MRLPDWPARLSATFEASRGRPFDYGEHDCCTFAADCIVAVTGRDVAAAWRGGYQTLEDGMRLAKARSLAQLASRFFAPIAPAFARRGDIALAPVGRATNRRALLMLLVVDGTLLRTHSGGFVAQIGGQPWRAHRRVRCWRVD